MTMNLSPQPVAVHGGAAISGIDLSASLNPLGPSRAALRAAGNATLTRYPEPAAAPLGRAAANRHRVPVDSIVPVPGASWGLWLCGVGLLCPGDRCVGVSPAYAEYRRCAELARAEYCEVAVTEPPWQPDLTVLERALEGAAVCFLANPGNPTGALIAAGRLRQLCAAHSRTTFIVDEAFVDFAPPDSSLIADGLPPENAVVVRSLTKSLGLPGLRMGYLVARPDLALALGGMLPPWPLSAPALAAAVAGLADVEHVTAGAALARRTLRVVGQALVTAGAVTFPSAANYLLARGPGLAPKLARHGITVRDCASMGMAGYIRVAAPGTLALRPTVAAIMAAGRDSP